MAAAGRSRHRRLARTRLRGLAPDSTVEVTAIDGPGDLGAVSLSDGRRASPRRCDELRLFVFPVVAGTASAPSARPAAPNCSASPAAALSVTASSSLPTRSSGRLAVARRCQPHENLRGALPQGRHPGERLTSSELDQTYAHGTSEYSRVISLTLTPNEAGCQRAAGPHKGRRAARSPPPLPQRAQGSSMR